MQMPLLALARTLARTLAFTLALALAPALAHAHAHAQVQASADGAAAGGLPPRTLVSDFERFVNLGDDRNVKQVWVKGRRVK